MGEPSETTEAAEDRRLRVAVLGGGAAGMTAAFELTRTPELRERFHVTVFQPGWRLGGKGASGRDPQRQQRIEEHGLHVWFGFYRNAFDLLESCFREIGTGDPAKRKSELGRRIPWARHEQAFVDCDELLLSEEGEDGWRPQLLPLPESTPQGRGPIWWWLPRYLIREFLEPWFGDIPRGLAYVEEQQPEVSEAFAELVEEAVALERSAPGEKEPEPVLRARAKELSADPPEGRGVDLLAPIPWAAGKSLIAVCWKLYGLERRLKGWADGEPDPGRKARIVFFQRSVCFAKASLALLAKGVVPEWGNDHPAPFDPLNWFELREALSGRLPKARPGEPKVIAELRERLGEIPPKLRCALETKDLAVLRVLYDLAFSYKGGDPGSPDVAAGVALENLTNIAFRHKGSLMRKMVSGMGDVVFSPLYAALKERRDGSGRPSVSFEFFRWTTDVVPMKAGGVEVALFEQARVKGDGEYDPFAKSSDLFWANAPDPSQLEEKDRVEGVVPKAAGSERPQYRFERFKDPLGLEDEPDAERPRLVRKSFDYAVIAISVGGLASSTPTLIGACPPLQDAVKAADPVSTQAMQVWLTRPLRDKGRARGTGWKPESREEQAIAGGYAKPFDTFCDMTHMLGMEGWPKEGPPKQLAYFCGVLENGEGDRDSDARANGLDFLQRNFGQGTHPFWQRLTAGDLFDPAAGSEADEWKRFDAQYWRANAIGWERYATSHVSTVAKRVRPDGSPWSPASRRTDSRPLPAVAFAGDWTYTPVNAGSFEAAVMSGIEAAAAIVADSNDRSGMRKIDPPEIKHLAPWRSPIS